MDVVLSVDWLRANATKAHFFGLGFIQVKLDDLHRVHFYHRDIPAFVEEPHDHRYDFVSTVLRGCLQNQIWKIAPGDDHEVSFESCQQGGSTSPNTTVRAGVTRFGSFDTHAGSGYHMSSMTFHTVHPLFEHGPVITSIKRELPTATLARVIRKVGAAPVCPFSRPMPDDELWQIVRDCIG
jgi:hypothetical protein